MTTKMIAKPSAEISWQALTYFELYRFFVAFLFVSLFWIGRLPQPIGDYDATMFFVSVHIYLIVALAAIVFTHLQVPPYRIQVAVQVFLDIALITFLMYSSGGLDSGFGMLLVIVVAGGALLSPGRTGILFAAMATIAVLGHEVYSQFHRLFVQPNYTHAGLLGMTFFGTAFVSNALAARVQKSEALAKQRAIDIQNLSRLNEHIVQQMQTGIVLLDDQLCVRLVNGSARNLLVTRGDVIGKDVGVLSMDLERKVRSWLDGLGVQTTVFFHTTGGVELQASFSQLSTENRTDILVFLEDVATLRQRAQQLKLASLGRLTASIAHEVRNPLGAISHASQLLSESGSLDEEDRRLTAIIDEHSRRVNSIVENVLSIGRRNASQPDNFKLPAWLRTFSEEFLARHGLGSQALALEIEDEGIQIQMDPPQLHQVLWNLCENGIRYSRREPLLVLRCGIEYATQKPYIDIVDNGPGISAERRDQLFEPFFTTEAQGTGLGLYIAREMCEANQASLHLFTNTSNGCCFRINFARPSRQQVIR